jgi:hypothetical protein
MVNTDAAVRIRMRILMGVVSELRLPDQARNNVARAAGPHRARAAIPWRSIPTGMASYQRNTSQQSDTCNLAT